MNPVEINKGQVAYEAYRSAVGNIAWDGSPLPDYVDLGDKQKAGWEAAFSAVVEFKSKSCCAATTSEMPSEDNEGMETKEQAAA